MRRAASRRRGGVGAVLAVLVLFGGACGDRGGAPPGGDKPADSKAPATPNGFETSWFGHLSKTYDGGLAVDVDVAKAALRRLGIEVQEEKAGIFETTLEGESRDGTSLVVILKEVERGKTRIAVKVGYLLGDHDAAQRIHSEIQSEFDTRKSRPGWTSGSAPHLPDATPHPPQGTP